MEVTKLYNVILDLTNDEKSNTRTTHLNSLVTHISSNQAAGIKETLTKIQESTSELILFSSSIGI